MIFIIHGFILKRLGEGYIGYLGITFSEEYANNHIIKDNPVVSVVQASFLYQVTQAIDALYSPHSMISSDVNNYYDYDYDYYITIQSIQYTC